MRQMVECFKLITLRLHSKSPIESPHRPVLILLDTKYEIMHVSFGNLCGVRLSIHFSVLCRTYVGEVPQIKTYLVIDKHVYEIH